MTATEQPGALRGQLPAEIGAEMRCARERAGLSRNALAKLCGCQPRHLQWLEQGTRRPSLKLVERWVAALGLGDADDDGLPARLRVLASAAHGKSRVFVKRSPAERAARRREQRAARRKQELEQFYVEQDAAAAAALAALVASREGARERAGMAAAPEVEDDASSRFG